MVSVLASSVVDHGCMPQSSHTKDYNIGICCYLLNIQHYTEKEQRLVGSESR